VTGALIAFSQYAKPRIIYSHTENIKKGSGKTSDGMVIEMQRSLDEVARILVNEGHALHINNIETIRVRKVFCVLASPWFMSRTKLIRAERTAPVLITESLVMSLIADESKVFLRDAERSPESLGASADEKVLECKNIHMRLNGYETSKPIGKKARSVEITLYLSAAPKALVKTIEDTIHKHFAFRSVEFHTLPLMTFSVIRDTHEPPSYYSIIDIANDVTDISLIKRGSIVETVTFPMGKNQFIGEVAEELKSTPLVAQSILRIFHEGKLDKGMEATVTRALLKAEEGWSGLLSKSLNHISEEALIPSNAYILADHDFSKYFKTMIERSGYMQLGAVRQEFNVSVLDRTLLSELVVQNSNLKENNNLSIGTIFLNKLYFE
jgi:hypothetical protein